ISSPCLKPGAFMLRFSVIFQGKRWRVFGDSRSGKVDTDGGYYKNIVLTLGKDVDISVQLLT
ncbi:hypothetical protein, partial [Crocosphaera sp. Alani8]|uniref:hypothetical protein n=1 Tax=Crocosphaera sp. Alani8 TaxID=3038952 RepID=UPI00313A7D82